MSNPNGGGGGGSFKRQWHKTSKMLRPFEMAERQGAREPASIPKITPALEADATTLGSFMLALKDERRVSGAGIALATDLKPREYQVSTKVPPDKLASLAGVDPGVVRAILNGKWPTSEVPPVTALEVVDGLLRVMKIEPNMDEYKVAIKHLEKAIAAPFTLSSPEAATAKERIKPRKEPGHTTR